MAGLKTLVTKMKFSVKKNDFVEIETVFNSVLNAIILSKSDKNKNIFLQLVGNEPFNGKLFLDFEEIKSIKVKPRSNLLFYISGKDESFLKEISKLIK